MKNDIPTDKFCGNAVLSERPEGRHSIQASSHKGIPEFSDLLLACRHHKLLTIATGTLVAIALAGIASYLVNPTYHAEALVRVREQHDYVLSAQTSRSEDIAFFRSQAALVRSHQVLTDAFSDAEVQPFLDLVSNKNRVDWLESRLRVETQSGSEVISINVQHEAPEVAQAFCNAITRAYLAEITHRLSSDRQSRQAKLEEAAMAAELELDRLWDKLTQVAETVGSDSAESLTIRDQMQFQSYRDYAHQLQAAQLRGSQLQSRLDELRIEISERSHREPIVSAGLLQENVEVIAARKRVAEIDQQFEQMEQIAANLDSPQMRRLREQREFQVKLLEKTIHRVRSEINERMKLQVQSADQDAVTTLKQQVELNRNEKDYLRERLSELNPVATRITPKTVVPLDMSRHAVERQSRLADDLWKTLQELRIEENSEPRILLQSLATLPRHANHSRQLKAAAASGISGCMLVVFMIGYLEWRDCRVRSSSDVFDRSRFRVFGTDANSNSQSNRLFEFQRKSIGNGVREAAARVVIQKQDGGRTSVLMVTSCVEHEPRHHVSKEMALELGGFGRSVLLIDCDTDHLARLSDSLGASQSNGIRQIPAAQSNLAPETIVKLILATEHSKVDFLPIGTAGVSGDWIDPRILRNVVDAMKPQYDVILVNGPSMMGSAEYALLAEEVDSSIISVFIDQSRWSQLIQCENSAQQSAVAISGVILHQGTEKLEFRLQPNEPIKEAETELSSEDELQSQIDEMQKDFNRIHGAESIAINKKPKQASKRAVKRAND